MSLRKYILFILLIVYGLPLFGSIVPISDKGRFKPLQTLGNPESIWNQQLESRHSLQIQGTLLPGLANAGGALIALPAKAGKGKWLLLNSLMADHFDKKTETWKPAPNFTLYADAIFLELQKEYRKPQPNIEKIQSLLISGYASLAGRHYQADLHYPTILQLKAEALYFTLPFIPVTIILYFLAFLCLFKFQRTGIFFAASAFTIHTAILAMRVFILGRPPVSNMFETVVYVPWIAVATGFVFAALRRDTIPLLAATLSSIILLLVLRISKLDSSMENVQAVLNSQFWLSIHVLMVVGSYGVLIFSGILGHIYLLYKRTSEVALLIIQSMYLGTGLLIAGTLLGGVWAAQSWGRFWDWDPKESWAFISSCVYLVTIHAHRFKKIGDWGLAIGSIIGLLAIGFTWYGVNYVLGTGLHSYGFGSGGEIWFYAFAICEIGIVCCAAAMNKAKFDKIH
jgi:ABC-type transport system involved in cytochrome c biogenesis permease subunit